MRLLYLTFLSAATWPVVAWQFMLAVGVAHLHWWPAMPDIGYTTSLVVTFLLFSMITGGTVTTVVRSQDSR